MLVFKLTTSLNTVPALLTSFCLFCEIDGHLVCLRHIVYAPDSAVPTCRDLLFLPFKTTETLVKSCAKLVWLSDCGKVFKRSHTQAAIGPQKGTPAIELEPSIRLIKGLRTLKTPTIVSGIVATLAPPRMPSLLPVEFQPHSSTA